MIWGVLIDAVSGVLGKYFDNEKDKENALRDIKAALIAQEEKILEAQKEVLKAELSGNELQRSWRPHLMYLIMFLLVFNGVIVPIADGVFEFKLPVLDAWSAIPESMWTLLTIGMGGYIVGRTGEKMVEAYKKKP